MKEQTVIRPKYWKRTSELDLLDLEITKEENTTKAHRSRTIKGVPYKSESGSLSEIGSDAWILEVMDDLHRRNSNGVNIGMIATAIKSKMKSGSLNYSLLLSVNRIYDMCIKERRYILNLDTYLTTPNGKALNLK